MDIIVEYLNHLELNQLYSFNSLRLYKRDLLDFDAFQKQKHPDLEIKNLKPEILNDYVSFITQKGKSAATVNRKLTALRGLWNWLQDKGEVERDPFSQIIREAQYRNKTAQFLSQEEINILLDYPDHELKTKMILELFYATGIRIGEMVLITLADIDLENQLLTIPRSAKYKERVVPFNKLLKSYMEEYIEDNALTENSRLLFSKRGDTLSEREVFRLVREAAQHAGLGVEVSPSMIRNSFIKHMKERGAYDVLITDLTGQSSFKLI